MPTMSVNGIDVHYRDEGSGEDVIVLIHNLTSDSTGFDEVIPKLSKYYRVIAPDLRGHGLTTHCEDYEAGVSFYTFDNMVEDLDQLLRRLGVSHCFLFGQAYWGANIVMHYHERFPENVRGLVIASSHIISSDEGVPNYMLLPPEGQKNFKRMHALAREEGMMAVYNDRLQYGQFWSERLRSDEELLKKYAEAHRRTSPVAFITIPHITHERRAHIAAGLRDRKTAMMLLVGVDDGNNKQCIPEMRKDIPDIHIVMIPDAGHYPASENPLDFTKALADFCAGVERFHHA